jgi:hypothetical protein
MARRRIVAVVGARALPDDWAPQVAAVVQHFLGRGWGIGSGGARGADDHALRAVVAAGPLACRRSVVFLPGRIPARGSGALDAFVAQDGHIVEGPGFGREALLARSRRLAREAAGVVAFLWGPSRGSVYTLRAGVRASRRVGAIVAGGGATLPAFPGGRWVACPLGPVPGFRWEPADTDQVAPRVTDLGRIFAVPDGEPVETLLAHIAGLTPGERLWFETGVRVGDRVLVPYERLDDGKPAALGVDRLMRRLRCTAKEAFDLGECLLALDADATVNAHYVAEARRRGVAVVLDELLAWVARVAAAEPVPDTDALDHAEPLGDAVESVNDAGDLARDVAEADGDPGTLAWRVLGSVRPERVTCPRCRTRYTADDDTADLPVCPRCGTPDTWEARQDPAFRAILREIEACASRENLAALGRRLYARPLPRAQAGVAWTRYGVRKAQLEGAVPLGPVARDLLAAIERAEPRALPRLGAALYRRQHAGLAESGQPTAAEWRRVWAAYRARRPARSA